MASGGKAVAHFDGRHLHSANTLTIYIDDEKRGSFDGGSTRTIEVTPGTHTIRYLVYNDASESSYWLGPFTETFEAGMEYDITPGKSAASGGAGGGASSDDSEGSGSEGCGGCLGVIMIVIIAWFLIGRAGEYVTSVFSPSPANTPRAQATEQLEPPSEEPVNSWYVELSGFVFPQSDAELIAQGEIEVLSDSDLTYAINEIYARHGYIFRSEELREYYEQFSWYTGEVSADEFSVSVFNEIEQENWNALVKERTSRQESG